MTTNTYRKGCMGCSSLVGWYRDAGNRWLPVHYKTKSHELGCLFRKHHRRQHRGAS
ncbi:hypothetical protein [Neosynechococcus sphagnicola]|uniref:hypothetical protein n=1 Tax=Neosynechococcus sphagnicola TaxID=1501145 RepID=UPI0012E0B123|nr:hypothetical protein [Neosynechococcus sphagnicola]